MSHETTCPALPHETPRSDITEGPPSSAGIPSIFTGKKQLPPKLRLDPLNRVSAGQLPIKDQAGGHASQESDASKPTIPPVATGPLSLDATDRVFPIRSFFSVDPTPTPLQLPKEQTNSYFPAAVQTLKTSRNASGTPQEVEDLKKAATRQSIESRRSFTRGESKTSHKRKSSEQQPCSSEHEFESQASPKSDRGRKDAVPAARPQPTSRVSMTSGPAGSKDLDDAGGLLTARFMHVVTEGGHTVITGRDGETLQRCEDEPIHVPGAVQSFGMLLALEEEAENKFIVRVVSENSKKLIGYTPRQLFALESFTDILSEEQAYNLLDHVDFVRDEDTEVESHGPEVFVITIRDTLRRAHKL